MQDMNNSESKLPIPFEINGIYKENISALDSHSFVVCAMFTPGQKYVQHAERLAKSCERYSLPYRIYEVPSVHLSISMNGTDDPAFTKANFIAHNFDQFPKKNILYVDVDVLFVDYPHRIITVSDRQCDFAIYNWLNDEHNEAYVPLKNDKSGQSSFSEYYVYSHSIQLYCPDQLICSGGVQLYGNTLNARLLLERWLEVIAWSPYSADDECLDLAYNNFHPESISLNSVWLDKSCLRMPWWPHVKPVILHPNLPMAGSRKPLTAINSRKRFYPERCQIKQIMLCFPQEYIIDTRTRHLLKVENSRIVDARPIQQEFWIYPEEM